VAVEQFTDEQAEAKLAVALAAWPLYRQLEYTGADSMVHTPSRITLSCPICMLDSNWWTAASGYSNRSGFTQKEYKCSNCGRATATYYFYWGASSAKSILFFKVGQYPELEEQVPTALKEMLGHTDLRIYKNALRMRNFNFGIAAVTYLRRVVENRMNDMLEVMHEAAVAHNAQPDILARHEEMKKEKRFSVKIDYAGDLLPSNLRPAGQPNPMAILHILTSEGLHNKSDEECVDIFDACRKAFEYVFGKMRIEAEDAKSFVQEIAKLAQKKGSASVSNSPK
jgi:hypothetical protein